MGKSLKDFDATMQRVIFLKRNQWSYPLLDANEHMVYIIYIEKKKIYWLFLT